MYLKKVKVKCLKQKKAAILFKADILSILYWYLILLTYLPDIKEMKISCTHILVGTSHKPQSENPCLKKIVKIHKSNTGKI